MTWLGGCYFELVEELVVVSVGILWTGEGDNQARCW